VIENKPGAATNLGADFVAKAAPDGYTVLLGDVATYAAKRPMPPSRAFTRSSNSTLAPTHGYEATRESSM
jgi:tripartite-type tricarboxylate transporter receptor subunit TctC